MLAALLAAAPAAAHQPGTTEPVLLQATIGRGPAGDSATHAVGPGYWRFELTIVEQGIRELTVAVRDGCNGPAVYSTTLRDPAQYQGGSLPTREPLPPGFDGYCVRLDVNGKRGSSAAVAVSHPHDRGPGPGPTAWASTAPTGHALYADGSVDVPLEGWALAADGADLGATLAWSSNLAGPLGTGASVTARLAPGAHTITATAFDLAGRTATASLPFTVVDLEVTVAVDTGPHGNRDLVPIEITVSAGDAPLSGAPVDVDVFTRNGRWLVYHAVTDPDGAATVTHDIRTKKDGADDYRVRASVLIRDDVWFPTRLGWGSAESGFTANRR